MLIYYLAASLSLAYVAQCHSQPAPQCGTLTVSSPGLCFGPILDIHYASQEPLMPPPGPEPTICPSPEKAEFLGSIPLPLDIPKCVPAQFGLWRTYPLTSTDHPYRITGWFAAHESVDARSELDKLLRVAGSPYEYDMANDKNNADTRNASVLLVNRYDWMPPEGNVSKEFSDAWVTWNDIRSSNSAGFWDNIGLVDFAHAAEQTQVWSRSAPHERQSTAHGVWMYIPWNEYMWARIGFDDDYTQARSFLYFGVNTDFFRTSFSGDAQPIRKRETELERYERGIREGRDYSGLKEFNEMAPRFFPDARDRHAMWPMPSEHELLGPYPKSLHIFSIEDLEYLTDRNGGQAVRFPSTSMAEHNMRQRRADAVHAEFSPHLREEIADLVNEMVLAFMERIMPWLAREHYWIRKLLRHGPEQNSLDNRIAIGLFWEICLPHAQPLLPKVERFAEYVAGEGEVEYLDELAHSLVHAAVYLIEDIVFPCDHTSIGLHEKRQDGARPIIVPATIRQQVSERWDVAQFVFHSRVLWQGRPDDK